MDRTILHCDCNSFFASVETALNPSYRGVPMAVCGSEAQRHGIVLAKNEEAKRFGIVTAETVASAKRKCPGLVIAPPHYSEYVKYSKAVSKIYEKYTDMIEPFGIDESWLDVTASRKFFGDGVQIAERIRREVRETIGITVSIGVSYNKVFAKLGSDYKKPDAITVISRENVARIVYPLPVGSLLFVGRQTERTLRTMGIRTIGELAAANPDILTMKFGKMGMMLSRYARGEDDSVVQSESEAQKSISNGFTFVRDLVGREECRTGIDYLTEELGTKLRRSGMKCTTVSLKVKDILLRTFQKQKKIAAPTDVAREISAHAYELLCELWQESDPVRMLTVTVSGLVESRMLTEQLSLFPNVRESERRQKNERREMAIDEIRTRYGTTSILSASVMKDDIGIFHPPTEKDGENAPSDGTH